MSGNWSRFNITSIVLGFAFLYLPIVLLIIFSFNESKLVTVWAGFSTKWYELDIGWLYIRLLCFLRLAVVRRVTLPAHQAR